MSNASARFLRITGVALVLTLLASPGRAAEFVLGADVGWLPQMEAAGIAFRDRNGQRRDCLKILRDHGINTIRLRVFVNPSNDPRSGHCGRDEVVAMAVRARAMGFRLMIDFHYSDTWADGGKQVKPAAWAAHSFEQLQRDVADHTRDVLMALKARGVTPEWVQVGNEIRPGMLLPEGKAGTRQLAQLINAGYRATKAVDPRIAVIVHLDRGNDRALFRWFFDALRRDGCQFDVIGLSYYPHWLDDHDFRHSIDDLGRNLDDLVARYGKDVMVVETGGEASQPVETRTMLESVINKLRAVPGGRGLGVIYWEPQGFQTWSRYPLSCWDADGRPTAALDAFREASVPAPAKPSN